MALLDAFRNQTNWRMTEFPSDLKSVWSRLALRLEARQTLAARILLIGFDKILASDLFENVHRLHFARCIEQESIDILFEDNPDLGSYNGVFLNLDAFCDICDAVDRLRKFRLEFPNVAVVLVSSDVRGDDFGRERAPICDATLRAPITLPRLKTALEYSFLK